MTASGDANAAELALAVRCLATADVAQGNPRNIGADRYGPELEVTRGQMASFIARMIDASVAREVREPRVRELPAPSASNPFTDVPNGDVHLNNIKRLNQVGIVQGNRPPTARDRRSVMHRSSLSRRRARCLARRLTPSEPPERADGTQAERVLATGRPLDIERNGRLLPVPVSSISSSTASGSLPASTQLSTGRPNQAARVDVGAGRRHAPRHLAAVQKGAGPPRPVDHRAPS